MSKYLEILVAYALIHDEYKTIMLKRPLVRGQKLRPMQTNQIPKMIFFFKTKKKYPVFMACYVGTILICNHTTSRLLPKENMCVSI